MIDGIEWTLDDTFAAQNLCPYETVSNKAHPLVLSPRLSPGLLARSLPHTESRKEEANDAGYRSRLRTATAGSASSLPGMNGLDSGTLLISPFPVTAASNRQQGYDRFLFAPVGKTIADRRQRAVGIGYQQEVIARLKNHTLGYSGSQINVTLDSSTETFPLNQSLYLDFSHDTNIVSVLTAFGLTQFADHLQPTAHPGPHNFTVRHIVPFGARLDIEIIRAPKPVAADRSDSSPSGGETKYIHFVLNQRTVPLGVSFPECDASRVDGWCELSTFLRVQEEMPKKAKYDEACFGKYTARPYGMIMDGAPL